MSRIYDGLRQAIRDDGGEATTQREAATIEITDSQPSFQVPEQTPDAFETIQCGVRPEQRLVGGSQSHNLGAEKFRSLRHRLDQLSQHRSLKRLLVASSIPKEGKTVVAINLALTLARGVSRVMLIDGDMRRPGVHRALGIDLRPGLGEFLAGKIEYPACVRRLEPLGLYYLPAGQAATNPFELLQGTRLLELTERLTRIFDWIIIDSPPLVPFTDAHHLAGLTDAVFLVVRPGVTPRKSVQQAMAALDGAYVAGIVFNASDKNEDRYYYNYYPLSSEREKTAVPSVPA